MGLAKNLPPTSPPKNSKGSVKCNGVSLGFLTKTPKHVLFYFLKRDCWSSETRKEPPPNPNIGGTNSKEPLGSFVHGALEALQGFKVRHSFGAFAK